MRGTRSCDYHVQQTRLVQTRFKEELIDSDYYSLACFVPRLTAEQTRLVFGMCL